MFTSPVAKSRRRQTLERAKTAATPIVNTTDPNLGRHSFAAAKHQLKQREQQKANESHSLGQKRHTASGALDYSGATQDASPFSPPASKRQATESKTMKPVWASTLFRRTDTRELADEQMDASPWAPADETQEMDTTGAEDIESVSALLSPNGAPAGYAQLTEDGSLADALEAPLDVSRVLLQGERHAVFETAGFPEAVRQHLGSIDTTRVPVSSGVSDETKFAYVATPTVCLVWSYAGSGRAVDTVYQLAMPDPRAATVFEAPIISLVPASAQHGDVGVIACTPTGQIRYWDHIVFGLGGTERFHSKDLGLTDINDECREILDVYSGLHVVATKKGYMFLVTLQNSQGLTELGSRPLSKSTGARAGMLSRMSSLIGGSSLDMETAGSGDLLVGLAAGGRTEVRHSREVYALTRQRLRKWVVSRASPEKYLFSMNILGVLNRAAADQIDANADVAMLDIAVTRGGDVCILASLQVPRLSGQTHLAIAVLRSDHASSEPELLAFRPLAFSTTESLGQDGPERPRLVLPLGGPGLYVVMRKTVVVSVVPTLASAPFEEAIPFRSDDFLLGFDTVSQFPYQRCTSMDSSLAVVCLNAGVLEITAATSQVTNGSSANTSPAIGAATQMGAGTLNLWSRNDGAAGDAERVFQHQIEQAVFFGIGNAQNPVSFKITSHARGIDTALQNAALSVSQSILDSSSHLIGDRMDIETHLKDRFRFAHGVMQFISANNLTDKLSRATRIQLCANVEKLGAATSLWEYQNEIWSKQEDPSSELLTNLAAEVLEKLGLRSTDPLRLFFRHHVASVGELLAIMHCSLSSLRRALETSERGIRYSQLVAFEANRISISLLQSAYNYRFRNAKLYNLADESRDPDASERWTETVPVTDLLVARFEDSYKLCRDISGEHCASIYERIKDTVLPGDEDSDSDSDGHAEVIGVLDDSVSASLSNLSVVSKADANKQLANSDPLTSPLALLHEVTNQIGVMANLCLRIFVDRLILLQATRPNEAPGLTRQYEAIRSRVLLSLVPLGRAATAFQLAEEYHDLLVLVVLTFTTDRHHAAERVRAYVDMFGKTFADALFEYYEHREAWASLLNTHDESFDTWLKEYIDAHQRGAMPQVGWVHDVKIGDYGKAAEKLVRAGCDAQEIAQARTLLSLGKLAFFADESQGVSPGAMDISIEAHSRLEDMLGMCEIQKQILDSLQSLVGTKAEPSDDRKDALDAAILSTTPELRQQLPALYAVYREFVQRTWSGRMLGVEDLIDMLTLPDNVSNMPSANLGELDERSSLAVDVLSRASFNLPEQAYRSALRTIWRRTFTKDDWTAIHAKLQGGRVPDRVLRNELASTHLYRMLMWSWHNRDITTPALYLRPEDVFADEHVDYLATVRLGPRFVAEKVKRLGHPIPVATTTVDAIRRDYMTEDDRLRTAIANSVDAYYSELLRMVVDDVARERQEKLQQHMLSVDEGSAVARGGTSDDSRMEVEDIAN